MKTSENINELAKALAASQGEIKNATLNKKAKLRGQTKSGSSYEYEYKYADLAGTFDAVRATLAKNGIAVFQGTGRGEGDGIAYVYTRLAHNSGQWIESEYPIAIDLQRPQVSGSAYTYARRYSLAAICGIAAEEDDDAELQQKDGGHKANGGTRPAGPAEYIGGEMDAPKRLPKKDCKDIFEKLQAELYANKTQVDLKAWGKAAANRIHLMPEDWEDIIRLKYDEYMLDMKQRDGGISLNDVTEAG